MRARLLVAAAFLLVYAYAFPYFGKLRHANEMPRILLTQELVDRGTVRIDARLGEMGSRFDVSTIPPGCDARRVTPCHHYSNKAPGMSLLAVPPYLALKGIHGVTGAAPTMRATTWTFRFVTATLPTLVFLVGFAVLARRFAAGETARQAALVACALGSMVLPFGVVFMSHSVAAAAAGGAFVLAVGIARGESRRPALAALGVGFLGGLSVLVDYQSLFAAAAVGIYLLARAPGRPRVVALAVAGAVPSAAAMLLYHDAAFGSPWTLPYAYAADPAHTRGLLGMVGPSWRALHQAFVEPGNGLLVLMPWVLLAVVGGVAIARDREARARVGPEALMAGSVVLVYLVFLVSLEPSFGRAGWSVGPRYITVAVPFLAWLAAAGLDAVDRSLVARAAAHALVLAAVAVFVLAASTYPHWPDGFRNPLYEVSIRALREGLAPHSLGTLLGLRGLASLLPLYLLVAALVGWLLSGREPRRWATTAVAALLAAALLWSYGGFPGSGVDGERRWSYVSGTWEP